MSADGWSQVAEAWEARAGDIEETHGDVTRVLLEAAGIAAGDRVLELGAGTGHLAVDLAGLVGPEGRLVATDVAPGMVALITAKLAGVRQARGAVVDAAAIPGPAEEYDVVVSRMGLMFVPEPLRALQEIRRVLRPGGRLAAAVWGDMGGNPWMASVGFAAVVNGVLSGPMPTEPGGPFSLGDPDLLEKLAHDAGFAEVRVEVVELTRHYASATEHFDMVRVLAPPIAAALAVATEEQVAAVRRTAEEAVAPYAGDSGGYDVPARALVLRAS
ncbi:class I SAM-dependent methyltransferase [Nocardioides sp. MH1]|uniref:class I SAM-dependent methyltransferase n=1 Tax=Nocardioides sp. MH1 TaxID=3242490 RepID=UPI003522BF9C